MKLDLSAETLRYMNGLTDEERRKVCLEDRVVVSWGGTYEVSAWYNANGLPGGFWSAPRPYNYEGQKFWANDWWEMLGYNVWGIPQYSESQITQAVKDKIYKEAEAKLGDLHKYHITSHGSDSRKMVLKFRRLNNHKK